MQDDFEFHVITFLALLNALKQFNSSLPEELIQQINQVGENLGEDITEATDFTSLNALVKTLKKNQAYTDFFELYREERVAIQKQYSQQERGKAIQQNSPLSPFNPLKNGAADINYLKTYQPRIDDEKPDPNADNQRRMSEAEMRGRNF